MDPSEFQTSLLIKRLDSVDLVQIQNLVTGFTLKGTSEIEKLLFVSDKLNEIIFFKYSGSILAHVKPITGDLNKVDALALTIKICNVPALLLETFKTLTSIFSSSS
jgi:hypothetical protein